MERSELDPILLGGLAERTLNVGAVQIGAGDCEEDVRFGEGPDICCELVLRWRSLLRARLLLWRRRSGVRMLGRGARWW